MKQLRWTDHALRNLADRGIEKNDADQTLENPTWIVPNPPRRENRMRRYFDSRLQQEMLLQMLLRVVVEDTPI